MANEIAEVCSYLKSKSVLIPISNQWLLSCIECFKSQGVANVKELKELVFQQWLLADLSDIAAASLPRNCMTEDKLLFPGSYAVQLNYVVNIGVSFHKQLIKIRRPDVQKNLEVDTDAQQNQLNKQEKESLGARTLKMEITDGVVTVTGFEDQFIPSLQETIVPGKKAILVGPIECRKGVLFLRPRNIRLMGGEVDTLHIQNATENILARALNLPENPDPYKQHILKEEVCVKEEVSSTCLNDDDEEALMMVAAAIESEVPESQNPSQKSSTSSNVVSMSSSNSVGCNPPKHSINTRIKTPLKNEIEEKIFKYDFDDDFDDIMATQSVDAVNNKPKLQSSMDSFLSKNTKAPVEFDPAANLKRVEEMNKLKKELEQSYGGSGWDKQINLELPRPNREEGKILVDYLSESASLLIGMSEIEESPQLSQIEPPLGAVDKIPSFPPRTRPAVVQAPARIVKILKKPKLKGDKWCVSALVAARGTELEVNFSSEAVDKVFTVSAAEILARRDQLTTDPLMKERMNTTLKESQQRFSKLNCDMLFCFNDNISKPVVTDIICN